MSAVFPAEPGHQKLLSKPEDRKANALRSCTDPVQLAFRQRLKPLELYGLRLKDGQPLVTDNGGHIVDVRGLGITNPQDLEMRINQWPGVVTVGIFAQQRAKVCLLGTAAGVKTLTF